jgi:branched-chain amino acid transport system substrate-binding protein
VGSLAAAFLNSKAPDEPARTRESTMFKTIAVAGIALAASGWGALAAEQGITDTEILFGSVIPLSGPPALLGVAHTTGVKAAIAEVNAAGGVNGRKIRLIMEDDGYVSARTIQSTRKLIDVDKVFAIPGHSGSGQVVASMPVLEKSGIPTIASVGPVQPIYDPPRKNVFAVGQSYEEGIRELVRFLAEKNPGKKWGLITQDDDYGVAVRQGFEDVSKDRKLNVAFSATYKRGQQDFSSEMVRLKDAGVEVFLAGGIISENVAMVKELEKLAIKPVVGIFWPGRIEAVLRLMGPISDGIYAVDYVEPFASPAGQAFLEKVKPLVSEAEFKGVNRYTMSGYAGAKVLIGAMAKCGRDLTWTCTVAEMEKTKDLETGIMAPISFGPNVRFSNSKLQIMQADFATLSYKPVTK